MFFRNNKQYVEFEDNLGYFYCEKKSYDELLSIANNKGFEGSLRKLHIPYKTNPVYMNGMEIKHPFKNSILFLNFDKPYKIKSKETEGAINITKQINLLIKIFNKIDKNWCLSDRVPMFSIGYRRYYQFPYEFNVYMDVFESAIYREEIFYYYDEEYDCKNPEKTFKEDTVYFKYNNPLIERGLFEYCSKNKKLNKINFDNCIIVNVEAKNKIQHLLFEKKFFTNEQIDSLNGIHKYDFNYFYKLTDVFKNNWELHFIYNNNIWQTKIAFVTSKGKIVFWENALLSFK